MPDVSIGKHERKAKPSTPFFPRTAEHTQTPKGSPVTLSRS